MCRNPRPGGETYQTEKYRRKVQMEKAVRGIHTQHMDGKDRRKYRRNQHRRILGRGYCTDRRTDDANLVFDDTSTVISIRLKKVRKVSEILSGKTSSLLLQRVPGENTRNLNLYTKNELGIICFLRNQNI